MKRTNLCSMRTEVIRNALLERQTWFMVWFRMIGILKSTEVRVVVIFGVVARCISRKSQ